MEIKDLEKSFSEDIKRAQDLKALEAIRVKYLGRERGELTKILRSLKDLPVEKKRKIGPEANALRQEIEEALEKKLNELKTKNLKFKTGVDITRPGIKVQIGHLHPLTQIENRIKEIFLSLNFSVVEGPEVETDYYNFDALNIPKDHPARDAWNTFWLRQNELKTSAKGGSQPKADGPRAPASGEKNEKLKTERLLLRTHTSPMQIHYMETHQPPFQIIVPGRVFRYEAIDASHEINFHQIEGLMVGKDVSLANFKFIVEAFIKKLFGSSVEFRFRPSYFPFVEPGLEVDIRIAEERRTNADQRGKSLRRSASSPRKSAWLEVMGAGMVHPNVFKAVGYNPKGIQGFAFGLGLDRFAMIKYNIPDIRLFYKGDLRFINQF